MSTTSTIETTEIHPQTATIQRIIENGGGEFLAVDALGGRYPVTIGIIKPLDINGVVTYPARVAADQDHPPLESKRPVFAGRVGITNGGKLQAYWVGDVEEVAWTSAEIVSVTTDETR